MPTHLPDSPRASFDSLRHTDASGAEYWLARDLAPLLEYQDWCNFLQVVEKAKTACAQSGHRVEDHFGDVTKLVDLGSGARREIPDLHLSRYACYLIVQNGDPAKPVIAHGQTYFTLQTRRQVLAAEIVRAPERRRKRLALRIATRTAVVSAYCQGAWQRG